LPNLFSILKVRLNNLSIEKIARNNAVSMAVVQECLAILKDNPDLAASDDIAIQGPIGSIALHRGGGFIVIQGVGEEKPQLHAISIEKFADFSEKDIAELAELTGVSENALLDIQKYLRSGEAKDGTYIPVVVTIRGEKQVLLWLPADTIVYINSTNPVEIAKEILKRVLVSRPNASDAVVNRIFLLMVIFGLICVGFGVTLAVYMTKAQLKRSDYFSPVPGREKSFQHNYAANIKLK